MPNDSIIGVRASHDGQCDTSPISSGVSSPVDPFASSGRWLGSPERADAPPAFLEALNDGHSVGQSLAVAEVAGVCMCAEINLRGGSATARALAVLLHRRARDRAIRAEHAAVASERLKPGPAALAVVEELAGVGRHGLGGLVLAGRTGQSRLKLHWAIIGERAGQQQLAGQLWRGERWHQLCRLRLRSASPSRSSPTTSAGSRARLGEVAAKPARARRS